MILFQFSINWYLNIKFDSYNGSISIFNVIFVKIMTQFNVQLAGENHHNVVLKLQPKLEHQMGTPELVDYVLINFAAKPELVDYEEIRCLLDSESVTKVIIRLCDTFMHR